MDNDVKSIKLYSSGHQKNTSKPHNANVGINAGGAIIIIIFVVLCLTIFSLLSFASSYSDKKLADKTAAEYVKFNAAEASAEHLLMFIDGKLGLIRDIDADQANSPEYLTQLTDTALKAITADITSIDDSGYINAEQFTIGQTQGSSILTIANKYDANHSLYIELRIRINTQNKLVYDITTWKSAITTDFNYEMGRELWDGSFEDTVAE